MKATRLLIEGIVQGVGFRYFTERAARKLGARGHVRNLPDGSVEAVVVAQPDQVRALLEELRRGPRAARVRQVTTSEIDLADEPLGFEIRP